MVSRFGAFLRVVSKPTSGSANFDDFARRDVSEGREESNRTFVGRKRFNAIHVGELEKTSNRHESNRLPMGGGGLRKKYNSLHIRIARDPETRWSSGNTK